MRKLILVLVCLHAGCALSPFPKDASRFDAEVRSWGLIGKTVPQVHDILENHGLNAESRLYYPCSNSFSPECKFQKVDEPPFLYAKLERWTGRGIFCVNRWWISVEFRDSEVATGIRANILFDACTAP